MTHRQVNLLIWGLRLLTAGIIAQTLFFKFTAASESVYIFTKLGIEPWGRVGTGIMELVSVILLLIPRTAALGALLAAGIMAGAIFLHFTVLGIVVQNDGGGLFLLALLAFMSSSALVFVCRKHLILLSPLTKNKFK